MKVRRASSVIVMILSEYFVLAGLAGAADSIFFLRQFVFEGILINRHTTKNTLTGGDSVNAVYAEHGFKSSFHFRRFL